MQGYFVWRLDRARLILRRPTITFVYLKGVGGSPNSLEHRVHGADQVDPRKSFPCLGTILEFQRLGLALKY